MINRKNQWAPRLVAQENQAEICALLAALSSNEIPAIQIPHFLQPSDLDTISNNLHRQRINWYPNKENEQGRIGISTTEYHYFENGKERYFDSVFGAAKIRDDIFSGASNPITKIITLFSHGFETAVATDPDLGNKEYFTGLIRAMGAKSTLHFDHAPSQLPGWSVSNCDDQFALVVHLKPADNGGELNVYNHPWRAEDDKFNKDIGQKGTYGFTDSFLSSATYAKITPLAGDLIIFRSRNFHQVADIFSKGPRLTLGTFMTLNSGKLSLWS